MDEKKQLNPDIKVIKYGKRELKDFTAYPLSNKDQEDLTNLFVECVLSIAENAGTDKDTDNKVFIQEAIKTITDNLPVVFQKVGDLETKEEAQEILHQFTNNQLTELINYIWDTNFEVILKNVKSLVEKVTGIFPSAGQYQPSLEGIRNTESRISTEKAGEKVD